MGRRPPTCDLPIPALAPAMPCISCCTAHPTTPRRHLPAGILRGSAMLQALPCIIAAHELDPQPGRRVLDLCAAPGGKATMLAQLMGDTGQVVALDRTQAKVCVVFIQGGRCTLIC